MPAVNAMRKHRTRLAARSGLDLLGSPIARLRYPPPGQARRADGLMLAVGGRRPGTLCSRLDRTVGAALVAVLRWRLSSRRLDRVATARAVVGESRLEGGAGEFFELAEALRVFKAGPLASHPSDRALAAAAGVSPTTIGDWLRGRPSRRTWAGSW